MISDERLNEIARLESDFIAFPPPHSQCSDMAKELLALRQRREIPEGWKLVPVEPTKEMRLASRRYVAKTKLTSGPGFYRAMLAAAPNPPK